MNTIDSNKKFFAVEWFEKNKRLLIFLTILIGGSVLAYYFRPIRPLIFLLFVGLIGRYFNTLTSWIKYTFIWDFNLKRVEFKLSKIWKRAGIIEIKGGTNTGKTLCSMLLTKYLKGRKWNNVPNVIAGCQFLDLATLKEHREGNFKNGLVGVNNVLLIDEIWNFFCGSEARKAGVNLYSLIWFLSETSKTGWKVFYTNKQGAVLRKELSLITANKSGTIITKGIRTYCNYWDKTYYYLDIEFDGEKISIPFDSDFLDDFDNTWNTEIKFAKNKLTSVVKHMKPDKLTRMLKIEQSRSERMREEKEAEKWGKKTYPDMFHKNKFWEMMKEKGYKTHKDLAEESGVSKEDINLDAIKQLVDKKHRRGTKAWEKRFEYEVNQARINFTQRNSSEEDDRKDIDNKEDQPPLEIDILEIYEKVNKRYRSGSPKWNKAVEKEIDKAREQGFIVRNQENEEETEE